MTLPAKTSCFNCGQHGPVHHHHVVPRSLGGIATVPLCGLCHGKAHGHSGLQSISALVKAALAAKKDRGEAVSHAPYGYRAVDGRLVPDDAEQGVIVRVREARARGLTVRAIAAKLKREGVVSRKGRPLAPSAVGELIQQCAPAADFGPLFGGKP